MAIHKSHIDFLHDPFIFKTPEGSINVIYEDYSYTRSIR
jgi:hypothetical protein